jgi:hypothetical protein
MPPVLRPTLKKPAAAGFFMVLIRLASGSAAQIGAVEEGVDPVGSVDDEQGHGHAVEQRLGKEQQRPDAEVVIDDNLPAVVTV